MHAIKHFKTITKHRHLVIKHCAKAGILWQGLRHDLSKYTPSEFITGAKYFQGTRSPNEIERELYGYSPAWLHHKGRNRHHYEYWNDYNPKEKKVVAVKMPLNYLVEMFCDRVAASKIYRGKDYNDSHPLEYFLGGRKIMFIHKDTADTLEKWLTMLKEQGEEKTFSYIRQLIKSKANY